jgi:uncharacterized protein YjbI with pentapeptide repeats
MSMTNFQKADLSGADFTGSEMDRAELDDANLSKTIGLGTVDFGLGRIDLVPLHGTQKVFFPTRRAGC